MLSSLLWKNKISPLLRDESEASDMICRIMVEVPGRKFDKVVNFLESEAGTGSRVVKLFPLIEAQVPQAALPALARLNFVERIWSNAPVSLLSTGKGFSMMPWAEQGESCTGLGVVTAILDTGIKPLSEFVYPENRLVGWYDLINGHGSAYDDHGHGTYLAKLIAGRKAGDGIGIGIAPDAKLIGVKVLDRHAAGTLVDLLLGIEWCLNQSEPIDVIGIPLQTPVQADSRDPLYRAANIAWKRGVAVCMGTPSDAGPFRRFIIVGSSHQGKDSSVMARVSCPDPNHGAMDLSAAVGNVTGMAARVLEDRPVRPERLKRILLRDHRNYLPTRFEQRAKKKAQPFLPELIRKNLQNLMTTVSQFLKKVDFPKLLECYEFYQESHLPELIETGITVAKALKRATDQKNSLRDRIPPEMLRTGMELFETVKQLFASGGAGLNPEMSAVLLNLLNNLNPGVQA